MDYKNYNSAKKKNENVVPFQNGDQITYFYFASFRFWPKIFPKEFFNEIWLKVGEHEYIYNTEITFENKKYSVLE